MRKTHRYADRFAALPLPVMESEAWRTLPHAARTVLSIVAAQYNGAANGVQNLARATCRRFGIEHSYALKMAAELERRGLLVNTLRRRYSTSQNRIPSQWAVAWRDITHRDGRELAQVERAPNRWVTWTAGENFPSGKFDRSRPETAVHFTAEGDGDCGSFDAERRKTAVDFTVSLESGDTPRDS